MTEMHEATNPGTDKAPRRRVLVLDDEEPVRRIFAMILQSIGCDSHTCAEAAEALACYAAALQEGRRFDAVIMDLTNPYGHDAVATLAALKALDPAVCGIVTSGFSRNPVLEQFARYGFRGVLRKPFRLQDVAAALDQARGPCPPA